MEGELNERIKKTAKLHKSIKNIFLSRKEVPSNVKAEKVRKMVKTTLTYNCESWTLTQRQKSKITSTEVTKYTGKNKKI